MSPEILCLDAEKLPYEAQIAFLNHFPQVDECVAESSEGGVDAYACEGGYFLEGAFFVEAHDDDFLLCLREKVDEVHDFLLALLLDECLFVAFLGVAELVGAFSGVFLSGEESVAVTQSTEVDDEIVCDADNPRGELAIGGVAVASYVGDGSGESVLKDIVCHVFVLHLEKNVGINRFLITIQ